MTFGEKKQFVNHNFLINCFKFVEEGTSFNECDLPKQANWLHFTKGGYINNTNGERVWFDGKFIQWRHYKTCLDEVKQMIKDLGFTYSVEEHDICREHYEALTTLRVYF